MSNGIEERMKVTMRNGIEVTARSIMVVTMRNGIEVKAKSRIEVTMRNEIEVRARSRMNATECSTRMEVTARSGKKFRG